MSFLEKLEAKMVLSSPFRMNFFSHKIEENSELNKQAAQAITDSEHQVLKKLPEGKLLLCKNFFAFLTKDINFPIKFFKGGLVQWT